ncbi:ATP-binding cassette domain-containing protein [Limnohabitans sp.]|uniref:ATP-binding cassette domain-containing protein n=1 Tax=Limnohabitans sp. TaxID=1907725 RepID=UPI003341058F
MVERACKAIDEELSSVFFGHALAIRMDKRPRTVGTFASQIRHFAMVRNFMTASTLFLLADLPFALMFIVVIALIAGPVAIVPALFLPLAMLAGFAFKGRLARIAEAHMEEGNRKNGLLIEAIDGIESVKASGAEWKMLERWRQLTRVLSHDEVQMKDISSLSQGLTQSLQQACYIALVAVGAYAIGAGYLTMGGLIACTIISGRALTPIAQISGLIVQWQHARFALKGLDGIMALEGDTSPGERRVVPDQSSGHLRMEAVRVSYAPQTLALDVPRFQVGPGERVAVIGAVGSGKSTFIKALSGLYRPADGRVFLDDVDIAHLAPEFVREHVGYLTQDVRLFQGTLRDNLALGLPSPTDAQILEAARQTGLDRVIASHPQGLGIEISEGGKGLSGGQRQLVGLTRLLIQRPRILLLDEPTASMDGPLEDHIAANVFARRPDDTTLIVVTHKPTLLRHFTRVVVIEHGRIVADGQRDEVLAGLRQAVNHAAQVRPLNVRPVAPTTQAGAS